MARTLNKLSATALKTKGPGRHADGGGLYLQVSASGARSWLFRYTREGRAREMGLGPVASVTLAEARKRAAEARERLAAGFDPLDLRDQERAQVRAAAAQAMTFAQAAEAYIAAHAPSWRNPKHRDQWRNTLATYAEPVFGSLDVAAVDLALVLRAIEPIWTQKPETAKRLRGRIEAVLDWAAVRKLRDRDNPARWRGNLDMLLPSPGAVRPVRHHAALPYAEIGGFMAELRSRDATAARALEFCILTAARTGEVLGARWPEIDLGKALWTVPPERMKSGREHRVPLSRQALAILEAGQGMGDDSGFIFPGAKPKRPLSQMAFLMLMRRMGRGDLTAHGFRSTFKDWAAECTSFANQISEAALAHVIGDKTEAAYRRGDLFERRAKLMQAWADYCDRPAVQGSVTPLRRKE